MIKEDIRICILCVLASLILLISVIKYPGTFVGYSTIVNPYKKCMEKCGCTCNLPIGEGNWTVKYKVCQEKKINLDNETFK